MLYIFSGSLYRTFANFETNLKTLKNELVKLSSAVDLLDTVHVNGKKKTSTVNQGRIYKQELHLYQVLQFLAALSCVSQFQLLIYIIY